MGQNRDFLITIGQASGETGRALKYDPEFCMRIRLLAQNGEFPEAWAAEIGITMETMRMWCHRHPEFREAVGIARLLLATYWTRKIAKNADNPNAKPGMYQMLARRIPALYGRSPIDLAEWVQTHPEGVGSDGAAPAALDAGTVAASSTEVLRERLDALRRRRAEEGEA